MATVDELVEGYLIRPKKTKKWVARESLIPRSSEQSKNGGGLGMQGGEGVAVAAP